MRDIFHCSPNVTHKQHNLYIHTQNTTKFGNKSPRAFDAHISSTLLEYIKSTTLSLKFKKFIKAWSGAICKCSVCKWEWDFLLDMLHCYAQHFAKTYSELLSSMWDGAFCENYARFYFPLSYAYERGEGSRGRSVV